MQNKANLLDTQMNVSSALTKYYENERLCRRGENKPNTNPNEPNQTQNKPKTKPKQTQFPGSFQDTQNEHNLSNNSELYQ